MANTELGSLNSSPISMVISKLSIEMILSNFFIFKFNITFSPLYPITFPLITILPTLVVSTLSTLHFTGTLFV